ncbi:L-carnitine dehydratase/bile acid-inducible protein F [hydrothermal vent metagenome]|uniref:L-carnitine dehydratase/bile acid-inducible protein F n=1 Tax=hydrothermal vent metagenome TaxID=652676 RepID=A0A160TW67_9ZZZZ
MPLPLEGVRILDLTRALAGPFCTMILGDLGATVIKTEPTQGGDMSRSWGPYHDGIGVFYLSINRNKQSLAVNFREPRGLELLQQLARDADVVVENFKPGTTKTIGLDYDTLVKDAPRLIYTSITGFGTDGPYGQWPGYDQIAQGMSGMMSITGQADGLPTRLGVPLADLVSGIWSALGTITALHQRERTGSGQKVETSLLAGVVGMLCVQGQRYLSLGETPQRIGNEHPVIYPYGAFEAADGIINIAAATQSQWENLCHVLDLDHLVQQSEFVDNNARSSHREQLRKIFNSRLCSRSAIEWTTILMENGVPAGPVFDLQQLFEDPHVAAMGLVELVDHPQLGEIKQLSNPLRLESIGSKTVRSPPPLLGQHTDGILKELGLKSQALVKLKEDGIIFQSTEST